MLVAPVQCIRLGTHAAAPDQIQFELPEFPKRTVPRRMNSSNVPGEQMEQNGPLYALFCRTLSKSRKVELYVSL